MAGRPKKSDVWEYFKYDKGKDKTLCTVTISNNHEEPQICGKELKGQFATNLKSYLKCHHNEIFKKVEAFELQRKTTGNLLKRKQVNQHYHH